MNRTNETTLSLSQKRRRTDSFDQDESTLPSYNNSDQPIDLSQKQSADEAVPSPPTEIFDEESNNSATTSSSDHSFQSYFSGLVHVGDDNNCGTTEDANGNASPTHSDASKSRRELLFAEKNRNICTIFKSEKLRKELVDKLIEANADKIDCHAPNVSMIRSFVHVERTESEQAKRDHNTEAARVSRQKRAILEKAVAEMAASKEILHKQLLAKKAAMLNYCNQLDKLL